MSFAKIFSYSDFLSVDVFYSFICDITQRVHEGDVFSDEYYTSLLESWVVCLDGTPIEKKREAQLRILSFLYDDSLDLDLSGLALKTIPPLFQLHDMLTLNLSDNELDACDSFTFLGNPLMWHLILSRNNFSEFNDISMLCSDSLRVLELAENNFSFIKNDYFKSLPCLSTLDLSSNSISELDDDFLLCLNHLEVLKLSFNQLRHFSYSVASRLTQISFVDLQSNLLNDFDITLYKGQTSVIHLMNNPISLEKSSELLKMMLLDDFLNVKLSLPIKLSVDGCVKSSFFLSEDSVKFPTFLNYCASLNAWVDSEDGSSIENRERARSIILNALVSPGFSLDLSGLSLYSMPPFLDSSKLKFFDLSDNCLSEFDFNVLPPGLRSLSLKKNSLSVLRNSDSLIFSNLVFLNLSINCLTEVDKYFFQSMPKLTTLELTRNQISWIDDDAFSNQTELRSLHLSYNHLTYLSPLIWRNLCELTHVDLHDNLLVTFDWFLQNPARPRIMLFRNPLSLDTLSNLTMYLNSADYQGPNYRLSRYRISSRSLASITLDSFAETLALWGVQNPVEKWGFVLEETSAEKRVYYNNLNIFLNRLYNGVGRNTDGSLPKEVFSQVTQILSILECYHFDKGLLNSFCDQAFNAVSECVDRIGIVLVWLSIYFQRYDAEQKGLLDQVKYFDKHLSTFEQVIQFVEDVNNCAIVFDSRFLKFKRLSDLMSGGIFLPSDDRMVHYEDSNLEMRQRVVSFLNTQGSQLQVFVVRDQVEDVFLIINTLIEKGLSEIESISMKFGRMASLRQYLDYVIAFLCFK